MAQRLVLVPGAWHGAWAWEPILPALRARGFDPVTVELPSTKGAGDLRDDAGAVRAAVRGSTEPTVVVAHSYAGIPTSEATAGLAHVTRLVYVCAFMLDTGQSLTGVLGGAIPPWWDVDDEAGLITVNDARTAFYGDVDEELATQWSARLGAQTTASFQQPQLASGWHTIPSTYVVCNQDGAIPLEAQRGMAQQADHVVELDSAHSPFASRIEELADAVAAVPAAKQPQVTR
ncbi:alpha/beta hydrolase [Amycolatopsis sp. CA-161197]|uniref:alpha/beta hydrolase n=1 Tax=Amycolatopsis sp. CA-161197 TaxID=3239922 RepID=UPI003D9487F0